MSSKKTVIEEQVNGIWTFIYPPEVEMVVVSGDIHGAFREIVNKVACQYNIQNALVIIAGDCGFGFEREGYYENIYQRCSKHLKKNNLYIAFVRGNHDNPAYFNERIINKDRWRTIPDYSVIKAAGKTVLCMGGAVSVDRQYRIDAKPFSSALHYHGRPELRPGCYWPSEPIVYESERLDEISRQHMCDTVVTHTAPSWCKKANHDGLLNLAKNDPTLLDDVDRERHEVDKIYEHLKAAGHPMHNWIYGHFHNSWHADIDGTMFSMLDCEELKQLY